ncbi:MAG: hypothetical protein V7L04_02550 [Nostoc sp.]
MDFKFWMSRETGIKSRFLTSLTPMPNAQCPMPNAQCPIHT